MPIYVGDRDISMRGLVCTFGMHSLGKTHPVHNYVNMSLPNDKIRVLTYNTKHITVILLLIVYKHIITPICKHNRFYCLPTM